jgi:hypothetical protein
VLPVLLQQGELERVGNLVRGDPRFGLRLEPADDQAADLLLEVGVAVGVAEDRQLRVHAVDLVGDHVEVLGRVQRHRDPDQLRDLLGPLPCAVDDDLGLDITVVGADSGDRTVLGEYVEHADSFRDGRATGPGTLGQRHGQVGRVRLPVAGQPDRSDQVLHLHHRVPVPRLGRGEQLALEVERLGRRGRPAQLGHPVLGAGHGDTAAPLEARAESGLLLEAGVELRRVLHQPGAALGGPQLTDQPGRVPGGAARQRALLDHEHVGPAEPGEVVGHARADHATPDDDNAGPVGQLSRHAAPHPGVGGSRRW